MQQMTPAAVERSMKLHDMMLRAMAQRITWYQAAEILGISCRQMLNGFKHDRGDRPAPENKTDVIRSLPQT